ncbi:hypothetical protein SAMN04488020_11012 [Palleronia marisminoris]|uniref:Uncharacterized protein n=1 Tax=Palleronia marisminoris TaxID=315423 RepID=A0A1Y5TIW7_9RHOB|nr:hypothetical protein SAMN04488020_11012 [Palleronia marisminoris]SLN61406.1 hypothetical protein PAM7066_03066 [Palleronia marisminoris]
MQDLIIDLGSVSDTYVNLAVREKEQTGPYILIVERFENTPEALRPSGEPPQCKLQPRQNGRRRQHSEPATHAVRALADVPRSGGLVAHHGFGARTGAAPVMIGLVLLVLASLPAGMRSAALKAIPAGTLGALLLSAA